MPDVRRACAALHLGTDSFRSRPRHPRDRRFPSSSRALSPRHAGHTSRPLTTGTHTAWSASRSSAPRRAAQRGGHHATRRAARLSRFTAIPRLRTSGPSFSRSSPVRRVIAQHRRSAQHQEKPRASQCPASQHQRPPVPSRLISAPAKPPWSCPTCFGGHGHPPPAPNPFGRA